MNVLAGVARTVDVVNAPAGVVTLARLTVITEVKVECNCVIVVVSNISVAGPDAKVEGRVTTGTTVCVDTTTTLISVVSETGETGETPED